MPSQQAPNLAARPGLRQADPAWSPPSQRSSSGQSSKSTGRGLREGGEEEEVPQDEGGLAEDGRQRGPPTCLDGRAPGLPGRFGTPCVAQGPLLPNGNKVKSPTFPRSLEVLQNQLSADTLHTNPAPVPGSLRTEEISLTT